MEKKRAAAKRKGEVKYAKSNMGSGGGASTNKLKPGTRTSSKTRGARIRGSTADRFITSSGSSNKQRFPPRKSANTGKREVTINNTEPKRTKVTKAASPSSTAKNNIAKTALKRAGPIALAADVGSRAISAAQKAGNTYNKNNPGINSKRKTRGKLKKGK